MKKDYTVPAAGTLNEAVIREVRDGKKKKYYVMKYTYENEEKAREEEYRNLISFGSEEAARSWCRKNNVLLIDVEKAKNGNE